MDVPGKTTLIERILGIEFHEAILTTIGCEKMAYFFENYHKKYKLIFLDTAGQERFKSIAFDYSKVANIVIYLFDLSDTYNEISLNFINEIRENITNAKIYIVGNKLDLLHEKEKCDIINEEYFERFRSKIIEVMNKNLVDKYFEVSAKTMEGVDKMMNYIKLDSLIHLRALYESLEILDPKKNKNKKKLAKKEKCFIY